jgi:futalosine hydrolase
MSLEKKLHGNNILIVCATQKEIEANTITVIRNIEKQYAMHCFLHYTGVGSMISAVTLMQFIKAIQPAFIIQTGIAGCFHAQIPLASSVIISEEILADCGVEENGQWNDVFDMQLLSMQEPPFTGKKLFNPHAKAYNLLQLPLARAVTVNEITTRKERILQYIQLYHADAETMEGAALHYTALLSHIPFIQIRTFSNYVGERNKSKWQLAEAIRNANEVLIQYLHNFAQQKILKS